VNGYYATNILFTLQNAWTGGHLGHFWTLAIEEQFYFFWPVVIRCISPRKVMAVCGALLVAAPACRSILYLRDRIPGAFIFTPCRMDSLAVGALLAAALRDPAARHAVYHWSRRLFWITAACVIFLAWFNLWSTSLLSRTIGVGMISALAVLFGAMVAECVRDDRRTLLSRLMSNRLLRAFGKYSYGLYVLHMLLQPWLNGIFPAWEMGRRLGSYWAALGISVSLQVGVSFAAAWLSYHCLEKHLLSLKTRFTPA
jgi:peptidoglycan/LPS O-acetylase OafA/YrhL